MDLIRTLLSQGWVGTVVGLVGIVLAIVFYFRSKRKAKLAFQHDDVMLVGGRGAAFPDEIEIRFSGTIVPRISASQIVIWNCGDRTINGSDVVAGDPLRLELPVAGRILKYEMLRQTRSVNGWRVDQPAPNLLNLTFDFLDPGDGISVEVTHSEAGSELDCKGTIKGMPAGIRNYGWARLSVHRHLGSTSYLRVLFKIMVVIGVAMVLYGLLLVTFGPEESVLLKKLRWPIVISGLLYVALPGYIFWNSRRRYPAVLEPTPEGGDDAK